MNPNQIQIGNGNPAPIGQPGQTLAIQVPGAEGVLNGLNSIATALQTINSNTPNNPYRARMWRGTSTQAHAGASTIKVQINTKSFDPNGNFDPTTNYRYTAPVTGYYHVTGRVDLGSSASRMFAEIWVNGAAKTRGTDMPNANAASNNASVVSDLIFLTANDYVELYCYSATAQTIQFGENITYMSVSLVAVPTPTTITDQPLASELKLQQQADTTNSTLTGVRVQTGWGVMTPGVASTANETVTFPTAFTNKPIVLISYGGDHASSTTYGNGGLNIKANVITVAHSITNSSFGTHVRTSDGTNWAAGNTVFYQWIAIGS